MKTNHRIVQWPVLLPPDQVTMRHASLLGLMLGLFVPVFAGATDFYSYQDGSWFDVHTWIQLAIPGDGDNIIINGKHVLFDSSSVLQSVTVSNLSLANGYLESSGPATLTMNGTNTLFSGTNIVDGVLQNQGSILQAASSLLYIRDYNGAHFENLVAGTYALGGDVSILNGSGGSGSPQFENYGLVRKSAGTGTSTISSLFNSHGGTIQVDSGTLVLGGGGSSSSGTFNVVGGAVVDLTGGVNASWSGQMAGTGAGQVVVRNGGLIVAQGGLTFNFPPGLFWWTGGTLNNAGAGYYTNAGVLNVQAVSGPYLAWPLVNQGLVRHPGAGALINASAFENLAGGTNDFAGDASISGGTFDNWGLLRKSAGTSTSTVGSTFNNHAGTIEVDAGTVVLSGGSSSNGTFKVAAGAVLDLTGGGTAAWAGRMTGSGAGQVLLHHGTLAVAGSGLTFNFPPGLFWWTGGVLNNSAVTYYTNAGVLNVLATNGPYMVWPLFNLGLIEYTGTGTLGSSSALENLAGGTNDFAGDAGISGGSFDNWGLLSKSGGTGTSIISSAFNNHGGAIRVDSGRLSLNGQSYAQGSGSLTVSLGGANAGQCGQLACGGATLDGPLEVTLANGFAPTSGNQFQIISCSSLAGAFTATNVPAGISVTYSNNGVHLIVTGPVPAQILSPQMTGGNFTFSIGTATNQSYTVQQSTNLPTTNWSYYTNFTGSGSLMQIVVPVTSATMRFFRVREP